MVYLKKHIKTALDMISMLKNIQPHQNINIYKYRYTVYSIYSSDSDSHIDHVRDLKWTHLP